MTRVPAPLRSCTEPPELEREDAYMLRGADGKVRHPLPRRGARQRASASVAGNGGGASPPPLAEFAPPLAALHVPKNGENRLRSLLVRTAEWKDKAQRARVVRPTYVPPRPPLASPALLAGTLAGSGAHHDAVMQRALPRAAGRAHLHRVRPRRPRGAAYYLFAARRRCYADASQLLPQPPLSGSPRAQIAACNTPRLEVRRACAALAPRPPFHVRACGTAGGADPSERGRRRLRACFAARLTARSCARRTCCTSRARGATKATSGARRR